MEHLSGSQPFVVLLCHTQDVDRVDRKTTSYYEDLFIHDPKGLASYWADVSHRHIDLNGTQVIGWRALPQSDTEFNTLNREGRISAAVQFFANDSNPAMRVDFSRFYGVVVLVDRGTDLGSVGNGKMHFRLNGVDMDLGVVLCSEGNGHSHIAHEMGHALGFDHSFDTSPIAKDPGNDSRPGAYGDSWDIMSSDLNKGYMHPRFYQSGPILNAVNMEMIGWLGSARICQCPQRFHDPMMIDLQALNTPGGTGHVVAKVDDYYLEFRTNDRWDAGIGRPCLLIHQHGLNVRAHSVLLRQSVERHEYLEGDSFKSGFNRVFISGFDLPTRTARLVCSYEPNLPPPVHSPCEMLRRTILAQAQVISLLRRELLRATSQTERDELLRQIDVEMVQLDGLYEDFRALGCSKR